MEKTKTSPTQNPAARLGQPAAQNAPPISGRTPWLSKAISISALGLLASCANFNSFSVQEDITLGSRAFADVRSKEKLITSGPVLDHVQAVTARLVPAALVDAPAFARKFPWETILVQEDNTLNAFCLPGGKMAVYTGILAVTQDDAGLAVVMGHEIAHATARHGTQAMTRQLALGGGLAVLGIVLEGNEVDPEYSLAVASLGAALLNLSYGRDAELEADRIGLITMARAGYDPRVAVDFWQRMEAQGGETAPEWLSTHPSHSHRVDQIRSLLPEALAIWKSSPGLPGGPAESNF